MSREQGIQRAASTEMTVDAATSAKVVESVVLRGDISGLSAIEKAAYYTQRCKALGLDPSSKPFAILKLNGKEILYADKGAADQLAKIHGVNRRITDGPKVIDLGGKKLVYVQCEASLPNGRKEMDVATVALSDPENVLMKAVTKCKRRATLAILGLGMLDETEVETIPETVKGDVVQVDLDVAQSGEADAPALFEGELQVAAPLEKFYEQLAALLLPSAGVDLWMEHRAVLASVEAKEREGAWRALCEKVGAVGKLTNAKVWMKKAVAERIARLDVSAKSADTARAETPRQVSETEGVLGSLTEAPDVTELRRRTVSALDAYPALTDAIWTNALGAALRHGCDEATFRRMVEEYTQGDPPPPAGGSGGGAQGGGASARGTGRSGSQSASAPRAANDVETVAARLIRAYTGNPFAFPAAVRKHAAEISEAEGEQLAQAWAFAGKAPPPQEAARQKLLARARGEVAAWLTEGRMRQAS